MASLDLFSLSHVDDSHPSFDPDLGLCIERIGPALESRLVVSSCLFIFQNRSRSAEAYRVMFSKYMTGLQKSLEFLPWVLPEWKFRLYVDYSLQASAAAIEGIGDPMGMVLDLHARHSDLMELYAVRNPDEETFPPGTTFLPSIWRYLAAFDPEVEASIVADSDNPISSLYAAYTLDWLSSEEGRRVFFIIPSTYHPPQCAAMALYKAMDGILGCPVAQFWGARSARPGEEAAFPAEIWMSMMAIIYDDDIHAYTDLYAETVDKLESALLRSSTGAYRDIKRRILLSDNPIELLGELTNVVTKELNELRHRATPQDGLGMMAALLRRRPDVLQMHILRETRPMWAALNSSVQTLQSYNNNDNVDAVLGKAGYGVDEMILHVILDEAYKADELTLYTTPTEADCGVQFHPHLTLTYDAKLPEFMRRMVRVPLLESGRARHPFLVELNLKTFLLLFLLRQHDDQDPILERLYKKWSDIYVARIYAASQDDYEMIGLDKDSLIDLAEHSFVEERAAYERLQRRMMFIKDEALASRVVPGVRFSSSSQQMVVENEVGFKGLLRLIVDAIFATIGDMHVIGEDLPAEILSAPWWES
jgi:hypothetical protein